MRTILSDDMPESRPLTDAVVNDGATADAMTDDEKLAVAEAYRAATATNNVRWLRLLHETDASTWHNFDGHAASVDESARALAWLHRRVPDLRLEDVSLTATTDGFVARWTMIGTAPGGPLSLRSCIVVELSSDGRVATAAEYVDSAALAPLRHAG